MRLFTSSRRSRMASSTPLASWQCLQAPTTQTCGFSCFAECQRQRRRSATSTRTTRRYSRPGSSPMQPAAGARARATNKRGGAEAKTRAQSTKSARQGRRNASARKEDFLQLPKQDNSARLPKAQAPQTQLGIAELLSSSDDAVSTSETQRYVGRCGTRPHQHTGPLVVTRHGRRYGWPPVV